VNISLSAFINKFWSKIYSNGEELTNSKPMTKFQTKQAPVFGNLDYVINIEYVNNGVMSLN